MTVKRIRGKIPTPLGKRYADWIYKAPPPTKKSRHTYTRDKKVEVLDFLLYYRVPESVPKDHGRISRLRLGVPEIAIWDKAPFKELGTRRPTYAETASYFQIPFSTIA